MITSLARSVFVALVATVGDYIWFELGGRHTALDAMIHGAGLLLTVGLVIGQQQGELIRGALGGIVAGVVAALAFYALSSGLGLLGALVAAWVFMWIVLAAVNAWVGKALPNVGEWVVTGLIAAIGSGFAFYLVSGIWTDPVRGDSRNYFWHLVAWTIAWVPGITTLTNWPRRTT